VLPDPFELPEHRSYSALKPGTVVCTLNQAPLAAGGTAELTLFLARRGYDDLVMFTAD
jgi:hypothetical protein